MIRVVSFYEYYSTYYINMKDFLRYLIILKIDIIIEINRYNYWGMIDDNIIVK